VAILTWAKVVEDEILSASFHGSIKLRSFFVHEEKKKSNRQLGTDFPNFNFA
jgi:hypothetical protein